MTNRIRQLDEKVQSVRKALEQIDIEAAAREAGVPASTLRYDLNKVKQALPEAVANRTPGPKPKGKATEARKPRSETEGAKVWGKGHQEWDVLGVELGADAAAGLVGRATGAHSASAMPGLWL